MIKPWVIEFFLGATQWVRPCDVLNPLALTTSLNKMINKDEQKTEQNFKKTVPRPLNFAVSKKRTWLDNIRNSTILEKVKKQRPSMEWYESFPELSCMPYLQPYNNDNWPRDAEARAVLNNGN